MPLDDDEDLHRTGLVLHLSPHSDDEAVGVPVTLLSMRSAGWRVINLLGSLGAAGERERRRAEAERAAEVADFELVTAEELSDLDLEAFEVALATYATSLLEEVVASADAAPTPVVVVSPSPHDGHPRHEAVGRVASALLSNRMVTAWWCYSIWGDLPIPSLYLPFDHEDLAKAIDLLSVYAGEVSRNDYRQLLRGRAEANAVLGSERVFGFGRPSASDLPYAEILTEVRDEGGRFRKGRGRTLDMRIPLAWEPAEDVTYWVKRVSDRAHLHALSHDASAASSGVPR